MTEAARRPLTVALPTGSFLPVLGGAEVGLHNIARRLAARGHRPVVLAPFGSWWRLRRNRQTLPYRIWPCPPKQAALQTRLGGIGRSLLDAYLAIVQSLLRADLWHATIGFPTGVAAVRFCTGHGLPCLVRCVGEDIQRDAEIGYGLRLDPRVDALVRRWLPRADRLVAISETVEEEYAALGVGRDRIARIPNGVDLARFRRPVDRAAVRRRHGLSADDVVLLSVGRYHRKKNFEGLLRAFAAVPDRRASRAKLMLAGAGVGRLRELAVGLGIDDEVVLVDPVPSADTGGSALEVPSPALVELYRAADIFVFASLIETFGIVLVEAMAAHLPVVATDAPGVRDVVRGGADALTAPVGDDAALAASMARMLTDAALRDDSAARSAARAQDFDWDSIVDAYEELYCGLLKDAPRRARSARPAPAR